MDVTIQLVAALCLLSWKQSIRLQFCVYWEGDSLIDGSTLSIEEVTAQ